jgi:hypothetical protein
LERRLGKGIGENSTKGIGQKDGKRDWKGRDRKEVEE